MSVKDVKIVQLEKELAQNKFDSKQILNEIRALFPNVNSLSIAKSSLVTYKDSTATITAVIYDSPKSLTPQENEKLRKWLNARLSVKDAALFKRQ
ncbi:hypothetical protein D3C85_1509330 [compost metagenome]